MERYGSRLPVRRLGRTGLNVPALALGGAGLGGAYGGVGDEQAIDTVRYAVDEGITYIDTSPGYGESERRIGMALEGGLRSRVVISTKAGTHPERRGDYSWDAIVWSVENSLRQLRTDYIEVVMVHDPAAMEPVFAPRGALDALEALKAQGKIGAIGLGQRWHEFHRQAIESGRVDVILTYNDYHPLRTTAADWLLPLAARHDVGVLNGAAMAHGLLVGDPDSLNPEFLKRAPEDDVAGARRLYQLCQERGIPMQAVVFQFCFRQPLIHCTLSGARSRAELQENLEAATMELPEEIWGEWEGVCKCAGV